MALAHRSLTLLSKRACLYPVFRRTYNDAAPRFNNNTTEATGSVVSILKDDMELLQKRSEPKKEHTILGAIKELQTAMAIRSKSKRRKLVESVDAAIRLNLDTRKQGQALRGTIGLPHGTGKKPVIVVFAVGDKAEEALKAGASVVGGEELIKKILEDKNLAADRAFATPDMMPLVGRVARILGPRGLMPNPKLGTMTKDVGEAVRTALKGSVTFKAETAGVVHLPLGNATFSSEHIRDNLQAVLAHLANVKPAEVKGAFVLGVHLSSTQGPGLKIATKYADPSSPYFMREEV